jgi:hypothetical protein
MPLSIRTRVGAENGRSLVAANKKRMLPATESIREVTD